MMIKNDWKQQIPEDFPQAAHVWIYQSERAFQPEEKKEIEQQLDKYISKWKSHTSWVKGWGAVLFDQFIILMADDTTEPICGGSVDKSVRFIKSLEASLNLNLLNRMKLGFLADHKVQVIDMNELESALSSSVLTKDSLYFNNAVTTKKELLSNWIIPLEESFLWKNPELA